MKGKLYGVLVGLLAGIICWFVLFGPIFFLGLQVFPTMDADGHVAMAVKATLFALFFTTVISIVIWIWVGRYIYKRHIWRSGQNSILAK